MYQLYLIIVLVRSIELKSGGAVYNLIGTPHIRLPATPSAKLRRLSLRIVVVIATFTVVR